LGEVEAAGGGGEAEGFGDGDEGAEEDGFEHGYDDPLLPIVWQVRFSMAGEGRKGRVCDGGGTCGGFRSTLI
jgi:hypothetical protein